MKTKQKLTTGSQYIGESLEFENAYKIWEGLSPIERYQNYMTNPRVKKFKTINAKWNMCIKLIMEETYGK